VMTRILLLSHLVMGHGCSLLRVLLHRMLLKLVWSMLIGLLISIWDHLVRLVLRRHHAGLLVWSLL
jgi:hypothetical protein